MIQQSDQRQSIYNRIMSVFDDQDYASKAVLLRDQFRSAKPFPHIVIDDFLPVDLANAIAADYAKPNDDTVKWKRHDNVNVSRIFVDDTSSMPPMLRQFSMTVLSKTFVLFLETLTGIESLIVDPYFIGGGAMASGKGEFLKVHADFNWHHKLQAHRRVNALLYMTPDWNPEWGGNLELWNEEMTECVHSIVPVFNRLVVFEVNDNANHGQPQPLNCPDDVYRRVFSVFCYTTRRDEAEWNDPHFTMYKPEKSPYSQKLLTDYANSATTDK